MTRPFAVLCATLVDRYEGKPFNRLNDLVVSSRGAVYFTDTAGIYYLPPLSGVEGAPAGAVVRVAQGIPNPCALFLVPVASHYDGCR